MQDVTGGKGKKKEKKRKKKKERENAQVDAENEKNLKFNYFSIQSRKNDDVFWLTF